MKLPIKRGMAALLVGMMLVAPIASPVQMTVGAEMTDQEREELRKQMQDPNYSGPTVSYSGDAATTAGRSVSNSFTSSSKISAADLQQKIKQYAQKNSDVIGWLYVPNTNINEPIVHNASQSNSYYEKRTWDGTNYPNNNYTNYVTTATFADRRTVFGKTWTGTSRNIVLYGHNWTNLRTPLDIGNVSGHTMFAQLPSYTDMNFATNNPYIYYTTADNEGIWKIFAAFYCEESSSFPYNTPNPKKEVFGTQLKEYQNRSMFDFSTDVNADDRILTLSTCTRQYGSHAKQRFVVMARLLRDGESDTDKVTASVNSDMKKPKL